MSTCISRHGEYSEHVLVSYVCTLCGVLDEDALIAELATLRAENERLRRIIVRALDLFARLAAYGLGDGRADEMLAEAVELKREFGALDALDAATPPATEETP